MFELIIKQVLEKDNYNEYCLIQKKYVSSPTRFLKGGGGVPKTETLSELV